MHEDAPGKTLEKDDHPGRSPGGLPVAAFTEVLRWVDDYAHADLGVLTHLAQSAYASLTGIYGHVLHGEPGAALLTAPGAHRSLIIGMRDTCVVSPEKLARAGSLRP